MQLDVNHMQEARSATVGQRGQISMFNPASSFIHKGEWSVVNITNLQRWQQWIILKLLSIQGTNWTYVLAAWRPEDTVLPVRCGVWSEFFDITMEPITMQVDNLLVIMSQSKPLPCPSPNGQLPLWKQHFWCEGLEIPGDSHLAWINSHRNGDFPVHKLGG